MKREESKQFEHCRRISRDGGWVCYDIFRPWAVDVGHEITYFPEAWYRQPLDVGFGIRHSLCGVKMWHELFATKEEAEAEIVKETARRAEYWRATSDAR